MIQNLDEDKKFDDQDSTKANLGKEYYQKDHEESDDKNRHKFEALSQIHNQHAQGKDMRDVSSQEANKPDSVKNSGISDGISFYNSFSQKPKQHQAQQVT